MNGVSFGSSTALRAEATHFRFSSEFFGDYRCNMVLAPTYGMARASNERGALPRVQPIIPPVASLNSLRHPTLSTLAAIRGIEGKRLMYRQPH
jgi:hypothetical protein